MNEDLAIIILAAGSSSRLGQSKQLLKIDDETLLARSCKLALDVSKNATVVLGANYQAHEQAIQRIPIKVIENKNWQLGMGNSLKVGINYALSDNSNLNAILVMVCDQPLLTSNHLQKLIEISNTNERSIISSSYQGVLGVPAIFKKNIFDELLILKDEEGARKIIQSKKNEVCSVEFIGGEIDLDTPADVKNFLG